MNSYFNKLQNQVKKGKDVFIANNATVIGDVELDNNVSIWYNAVLRADHAKIKVGKNTNIQDGSVVHVDEGVPCSIGSNNVVGHLALLHGCTIGNNNLIGMRSTIMNNATIGNCCIIGAHALVTENMVIPDFSMVLGVPGKIIKQLPEHIKESILKGVEVYKHEALRYLQSEGINI